MYVFDEIGHAASMEETFEGLEPNGQLKALSEANKHEFVRLSVRVLLWDRCNNALKAIRSGYVVSVYVCMCVCFCFVWHYYGTEVGR